METAAVQDNGIETSHGTAMRVISMGDVADTVESVEACQDELTIEDGSLGNGCDVQGAQVVGGNGSMVSGSIVGAGAQLGAAEDVGASPFGAESEAAPSNGSPRPSNWRERSRTAKRHWAQRNVWNGKYEGSE